MKTKTEVKNNRGILRTAMAKTGKMVTKANDFALLKTEEVVSGSLEVTTQWQTVADKAIKGGLKLAAKQQDLTFDALNEIKGQLKESKKRFVKLVN